VFINFVKKQQEIVHETTSDDGNFPRSSAVSEAGEFPQSSLASDDEALIDVVEESGAGRWFNGLQVPFKRLSYFKRFLLLLTCKKWMVALKVENKLE